MRTALLVALLAGLVVVAPLAVAQPDPQAVANETVQMGKSAVDGVVGGLDGKAPEVPDAAGPAKGGFGDAASAVGRFFEAVAATAVTAATATGKVLSATGLALAGGMAQAASAVVDVATVALSAFGAGLAASLSALGSGVALVAAWIGAQVAALLGLYANFIATLRPRGMDATAFTAIAATGAVATTAAAGYGLFALAKKYAWLLSGLAGFSRIEDSALLDHPLRAQVFQVIQANPGIHASELSRKVGAGWGTIVHHLDKLEKGRLVTARRVNNQKCFFEDGGKVSRQDMAIAGAVRGDSASLITAYVTAHPMTSQKAMAEELGISPALTSFHVKKLASLGVLDKVRRGKETLLTTTQAVRRVLTPVAQPIPVAAAQA